MGHQSQVNRDRRRRADQPQGALDTDTVVLAYIHPGEVSAYFTESLVVSLLVDIGNPPRRIVNILQEWSSANVAQARNTVTQRFLDGPGDWLMWIDADMQWGPDAVELLVASADADTRPIVGGLCFGMHLDAMFPTIYQFARLDDGQLTTVRVREYERDDMVQCAATGAAFLLVHRRVLEAMKVHGFNAAFPWFQETELGGRPAGEDLTFCLRAGLLGFPVHVNTGVRVGHHKSALLTEDRFHADSATAMPPGVGLVVPTRGDHPDLLAGIVAASGLPPERIVIVTNGDAGPDPAVAATWLHDDGPVNVHRWWNRGIDLLAERGCRRVAVLNDDVVIAPDTLPRLARGMGGATLGVPDLGPAGNPGHCWMLNLSHGVRPDESYRWWCGDLQLMADADAAAGVATVPNVWLVHLHANEATEADPELQSLAEADGVLYDSRHPSGPYARRTGEE